MRNFLDRCCEILGRAHVITDQRDMSDYLTDWRDRLVGTAQAVLKPATTEEVAAIVRLCQAHRVPLVPQGGNTGLVLGGIPDDSGKAVVLSLARMNHIRQIDPLNNTLIAEAGCILKNVQDAAHAVDRLYPLRLASEGTCTIGGTLSTNAGGTAVLRYGNARELCLGLEVVTPQGEVWDGLRSLRKDNSGYDLRDLYIGAEGTLGVITAAVLKLHPKPNATVTAFIALDTPQHALQWLSQVQARCGALLTGFEIMSNVSLQLVHRHFPQLQKPLPLDFSQYVLLELSGSETETRLLSLLEDVVNQGLSTKCILDAAMASSISQTHALWQWRENISAAQALEGNNIKHDISVAPSRIPDFLVQTDLLLQQHFPHCRPVVFGHLGDGNLHYNISAPEGTSADAFLLRQEEVNRVVYDSVHHFGGSIAAEHGVGMLKRNEIRRYLPDVEIRLMQTIKCALDPENLMNPGKII